MTRLDADWLREGTLTRLLQVLDREGEEAQVVGGAVRNALLGTAVMDVDIATQFTPDEVMRRLEASGLRAVATGIEHGTVTAIAQGRPYEVTSLRRDVETLGRRAVVAFTTDWAEDAMRRDFTINALYAAADGTLFDYSGGLDDISARRVRFIGDARQQIREDYLRILRFFRFYAWYGRGDADGEAIEACAAEKAGLKLLSGERIQKELLLLLKAENPARVVAQMDRQGILREILPTGLQLPRLERLVAIERANRLPPDGTLRLAALLPGSAHDARAIAQALRLSNEMRYRLIAAAEEDTRIAPSLAPLRLKEMIYRSSADKSVINCCCAGPLRT